MRRTTKVFLWVVTLLVAIASAAIVATFLILEWPRSASARFDVAENKTKPRAAKAQAGGHAERLGKPQGPGSGGRLS